MLRFACYAKFERSSEWFRGLEIVPFYPKQMNLNLYPKDESANIFMLIVIYCILWHFKFLVRGAGSDMLENNGPYIKSYPKSNW